jgi:hypothetical protein
MEVTAPMATHTVVYDDFTGDYIDEGRWTYLTILGRDGSATRTSFEPAAQTWGRHPRRLRPPPHFNAPRRQPLDSLRPEVVSRNTFSSSDGGAVFGLDTAATRVGEAPTDYGDGFASSMLIDVESGWSFQVCCNGHKTFGLYSSLRHWYHSDKPPQIIDAATPVPAVIGRSRRHEIAVGSDDATIERPADGRLAFRVDGCDIPLLYTLRLGRQHLPRKCRRLRNPVLMSPACRSRSDPSPPRPRRSRPGAAGPRSGNDPCGSNR